MCGAYSVHVCVCVTHTLRMLDFRSEVTPEHPEGPAV